jgi:ABC-2 type transport system ATP-binding protein
MIELVDLVKDFGEVRAVDGITLNVQRGEFFCVLGPNAAGKTTTIKMLVGLIRPTRGSARIAGFDVQAQPLEARRRLAYVPDFPFLYDKLTPWEFLRFTGQLFQMEEQPLAAAAAPLIRRFQLEEWLHKPIESLSHGTRQRVAIARAMVNRPSVILADEPTGNLDERTGAEVMDLLLGVVAERGTALILVTHSREFAERANRRCVLSGGVLSPA